MILSCSDCSATLMPPRVTRSRPKYSWNELSELSKERYVSAYSFALVYLGLGDKEEALRWLEKSFQDRAGCDLVYFRVEPLLDPLRGDPRFEELVAQVFAPKNGSSR